MYYGNELWVFDKGIYYRRHGMQYPWLESSLLIGNRFNFSLSIWIDFRKRP